MPNFAYLQYALFLAVVSLLVKPCGIYLYQVFSGGRTFLDFAFRPLEKFFYRLAGVDPDHSMHWKEYFFSFAIFGVFSILLLFLLLLVQRWMPLLNLNKEYLTTPLTLDLSFNTAISFATTTTWQSYGGENTMSYWTQMVGLAAQNFLAGAAGLAVGIAFIRGITARARPGLGNFWVDLTRALVWVLLPASFVLSLVLVWQGVPMNFLPYSVIHTLEGGVQIIAQGPVAALEAIKNLGTNGGGFFNVNGAHPFENPTPLSNFFEMLAIAVLPASLTYTFGRFAKDARQGWALYGLMFGIFVMGIVITHWAEIQPSAALPSGIVSMGNLEGKETRFGVGSSVLTAITTSNGATGSYNAMHDSFSAIGGMIPLANMLIGEIVFGGLGSGIYSMVFALLLAVFLAGLMVGRSPQYLQKMIGPQEMKLVVVYAVIGPIVMLTLTGMALELKPGLDGLTTNTGPHGLTSIFYAYTSAFANNGQNFAGLNTNGPFYNVTLSIAMLAGRFALAVPALALADALSGQSLRSISVGSLDTADFSFSLFVFCVLILSSLLSFFPALCLGPLLEHLL